MIEKLKLLVDKFLCFLGIKSKRFDDNKIVAQKIDKELFDKFKNISYAINDTELKDIYDYARKIAYEIYIGYAFNLNLYYIPQKPKDNMNDKAIISILKVINFFKDDENVKVYSFDEYKEINTKIYFMLINLYNKIKNIVERRYNEKKE